MTTRNQRSAGKRRTPGNVAERYAPIEAMAREMLAQADPADRAALLADLSARFRPVGWEIQIVERMVDISCRLDLGESLESEILRRGMPTGADAPKTPADALMDAYVSDFKGPNLLLKLSSYENRLYAELERCLRILQHGTATRKRASGKAAAALLKSKPCTSVVQ